MFRVAIIGVGGTGIAAFVNLVRVLKHKPKQQVQILLIEREQAYPGGVAFGTPAFFHRLNTPVSMMGIFPDDRSHFKSWLLRNREKWNGKFITVDLEADEFLPRPIFAQYLEDMRRQYMMIAEEHGIQVHVIESEAIDLSSTNERFWIEFANGTFAIADTVMLCLGQTDGTRFAHLASSKNYVESPWPIQTFVDRIPKHDPVMIIGTGLTAVDAVLGLVGYGHLGPLRMVSRQGYLPDARNVTDRPLQNRFFSEATLQEILKRKGKIRLSDAFRLFKQDFRNRIDLSLLQANAPVQTRLATSIEIARRDNNALQDILVATRPFASWLWNQLPVTDRQRFQRRFGTRWAVHRHPMPIPTAQSILQLIMQGKLEVLKGLVSIKPQDNHFSLHLRDGSVLTSHWLVDGSGSSANIHDTSADLVRSLLRNNLATPHPSGGISADFQTLELKGSKGKIPNLYGVGQLLSGELLATNAFWFNVDCAARVANRIALQLKEKTYRADPSPDVPFSAPFSVIQKVA